MIHPEVVVGSVAVVKDNLLILSDIAPFVQTDDLRSPKTNDRRMAYPNRLILHLTVGLDRVVTTADLVTTDRLQMMMVMTMETPTW